MNRLRAKFAKKREDTPLSAATKTFIKSQGDDGLAALPAILDACSSASAASLASQIEVLDLITKYYGQAAHVTRQMRCVDLLRYLSDQRDNELFNLLSQGHPLLKAIDGNLGASRAVSSVQRSTRTLLDHLVRQPHVPASVVELHAKHVNGINRPHRPTIILSDQEVVADDISAAEAESELLSTLLTADSVDDALLLEVHSRITNTRERLTRDVETSTNERQTADLIESIETIDRVFSLCKEMRPSLGSSSPSRPAARSSISTSDSATGYAAPSRPSTGNSVRSNGKGRANEPDIFLGATAPPLSDSSSAINEGSVNLFADLGGDGDDDHDGYQGTSTDHDRFHRSTDLTSSGSTSPPPRTTESPFDTFTTPATSTTVPAPAQASPLQYQQQQQQQQHQYGGVHENGSPPTAALRSNNPFAKKVGATPESPPSIPANPFSDSAARHPPSHSHFHSEGDLDEQWRSLKM